MNYDQLYQMYQESEQRFRKLLELSADAIAIHRDGIILEVNGKALKNIYGNRKDTEVAGQSIWNYVPKELQSFTEQRLKLAMQQDEPLDFVTGQYVNENERKADVEVSTVKIIYEGKLAHMSVIKDITPLRQAQKELHSKEVFNRIITDNMTDFISILDLEGKVIYATPSHEMYVGLKLEEYIGTKPTDYIHPDEVDQIRKDFYLAIHHGKPFKGEYRWRHADGHWISADIHVQPVFDEEGQLQHMLSISRDITERKNVEQELQEANTMLQLLSTMDGLTGIANRRLFDKVLIEEL